MIKYQFRNISPHINYLFISLALELVSFLQVIPQLIARIDTHRQPVGEVIIQLLMDIGKHHPQALIYPLTVAAKSTVPSRNIAANKILCSMTKHSGLLVDQAKMVLAQFIFILFYFLHIVDATAVANKFKFNYILCTELFDVKMNS